MEVEEKEESCQEGTQGSTHMLGLGLLRVVID